jgi:hypothetical protein
MALPLDVSKVTVLCGGPPQPVLDRETGEHRSDRDGHLLYRTDVVVVGTGRPEVFGVRTPKEPKALALGAAVNVTGLTVSTFPTRDGGTGVFYEAASIEATRAAS